MAEAWIMPLASVCGLKCLSIADVWHPMFSLYSSHGYNRVTRRKNIRE